MGSMKCAAALLACVWTVPTAAQSESAGWSPLVAEASARFGIPQAWIWRVMAIESRGRTMLNGRPIRSPKGAMGLMQLMPATWLRMRATYGLGANPDDPRDNILAGTAYLRLMYDRFGYPGLFGAYNAGPGRYSTFLSSSRPLPRETSRYVATVATVDGVASVARVQAAPVPRFSVPAATTSVFVIGSRSSESRSQPSTDRPGGSIVVIRRN